MHYVRYVPFPLAGVAGSFLLAFPALFSIVNPLGSALIFAQVLAHRTPAERHAIAGQVAFYSAIVLLASLWAGSYILNFFGISLGALRLGGGLVVAYTGWRLLNAPEETEANREHQAQPARPAADAAFYPLTMPLTTGPGTISVAVALGAERPEPGNGLLYFSLGMSAAALAMAFLVWVSYRWSDTVIAILGRGGSRVLTRLTAFLLLCIGTQIMVNGVDDLAAAFLNAQK
ncbi:MAG TPA: MarC family protein [Acetobacteraceae bacterium]|nr:MarC family protein [Acetobacteraceae bacterium]